tara:strand:+ start:2976 stop:3968 length:993 start_codon:yes stop_codon:yes gene_type:complete
MHVSLIVVNIDDAMKLSIITTLFNSSAYLETFFESATLAANDFAGEEYEIIFVNDGSPDNSLIVATDLAKRDSRITIIDLSRNFGHHKAMMTGISHAQGEYVFLIDCDLEEDVNWLNNFSQKLFAENADMVFGYQEFRKGGLFEKFSGYIFYKLLNLLTEINHPSNITTARLMSRRYVDALVSHKEREINMGGLWFVTGFKQVSASVKKLSSSPSSYTFRTKLSHLVNAITSFSSKPLVLIFYTGLLVTFSSITYILYLIYIYFSGTPPLGYTSILASIWLLSGLVILMQGILGIYISKIFSEVKARPYTIIKDIINFGDFPRRSDNAKG